MNNTFFKTNLLTILVLTLFACGGSKQVPVATTPTPPQPSSLGEAIEMDRCQLYAEDPTATSPRAWAKYNAFDMKNAQRYATALARADLAGQIATLVSDALEAYDEQYGKMAGNGQEAKKVAEAATQAKSQVKTVAEELIRGSRIAMSSFYRQADGTIDAYVCVEADYNAILEQLKKNAEIQRVISDTEKARVEQNMKDFEESMQESFEKLKAEKAKGL